MKKIILGLIFVLLVGVVSAANVCVVVQYPDLSSDVECVDVAENANGYEVFEATSLDLLWSPKSFYGRLLCRINGVGDDVQGQYCKYSGEFWNFNILDNGVYKHSPVGFDGGDTCWNRDFDFSDWSLIVHYCAKDGDVLGFYYGADGYPEMLNVKNIDFYVDGDKKTGTIKVEPDSKLEVKVELENLYSKESGIEINNVLVTATLIGIDDGEDIEEESDEFDLKPEKDKIAKISFDIPLEVEEDDYELKITIEAEDDLGIKYEIEKEYKVEVNKKSHEIEFYRLELEDNELECNRGTNIDVGIINLGKKEEDVILEITNSELNLNIKKKNTLSEDPFDEDNKFSGLIPIKISDEVKAGNYPIEVKAIYNKGSDEIKKALNLVIKDCDKKIGEEEKKGEVVEEEEMEKVTGQVIYEQLEKEDHSVLFVGLAAIIIIVALLIGIVIIVKK